MSIASGRGHAADADRPSPGEIYLEYLPLGHQLRVVAVDAATGVEVTVVGPSSVSAEDIGRIAARKLKRRLASAADRPVR